MSKDSKTFYVSTPIYFVNDKPHIGHAYTTVAADVISRYKALLGYEKFFLTGTDEHGQKIEESAKEQNISPKDLADKNMQNFKELWNNLNIDNDAFIRTTDAYHKEAVLKLYNIMKDKGDVYLGEYSGAYCTPCESYWTETQLIDENICPDCGRVTKELKEASYFFKLSKYQDQILEHIKTNPDFIKPESRRNEIISFVSEGLRDLSISRVNFSWGIKVDEDSDHVIYVWIDALTNYLSALGYFDKDSDKKRFWPIDYHIVGKDIIRFHAVYWPAMLMSAGIELPKSIFAHGWWTVDGKKMSKSMGNAIDPNFIITKFSADAFRYFLMREVPFGLDGDFSYKALIHRVNTDLANDLGNLVSRTLGLLDKYFDRVVPEYNTPSKEDDELYDYIISNIDTIDKRLNNLAFNKALMTVWEIISSLNKYIDAMKPWNLAKDESSHDRLGSILYLILDAIRLLSYFIYPFMPDSSNKIYKAITGDDSLKTVTSIDDIKRVKILKSGVKLDEVKQIFPRIDEVEMLKEVTPKIEKEIKKDIIEKINFTDFEKVEIKAGKILGAERVPKSDKLLKMSVDCGDEPRIIVSGIGKTFEPTDLIGKTVAVITNLLPAKLMGVESNGMILAATDDNGKHQLLELHGTIKAGTKIK